MTTVNTSLEEESKRVFDNLHRLLSQRDCVARLAKNPKKLWKEYSELVTSLNKIDTNPELEKKLAQRQIDIIQENWIGKEYPTEYLRRENRKFWKAKTDDEKQSCITMLATIKGYSASREDDRKHTNNFHMYFPEKGARMSSCKYIDKEDFNKLEIPANTLAKIYACLHVERILNVTYCDAHNAIVVEELSLTREYCSSSIEEIGSEISFKDYVWENLHIIFDRLVLESGYNPVILAG
jgi:hypothetical protein